VKHNNIPGEAYNIPGEAYNIPGEAYNIPGEALQEYSFLFPLQ